MNNKTCKKTGCSRPHEALGLCKVHYNAVWRKSHGRGSRRAERLSRRCPPDRRKKVTNKDLLHIYNLSEGSCLYCGKYVTYKSGTFDHVIPICKGGWNSLGNLVWSCKHCNDVKGRKMLIQFKKERHDHAI